MGQLFDNDMVNPSLSTTENRSFAIILIGVDVGNHHPNTRLIYEGLVDPGVEGE